MQALPAALTAKLPVDAASAAYRISAKDGAAIFYSFTEAGFDKDPPVKAIKEGVELIHALEDDSGKEVTRVSLGDEVNVHLKTRSLLPRRTLYNMAIVDLLPSGFELVLSRGSVAQGLGRLVSEGSSWIPTELDAREDRVNFYGNVDPDVRELKYRIKAVAKGSFALPPAQATGMYEPSIKGRSTAGVIVVE
jgi:uncharacterized protein YfaS (alpha-2-macroglobulin family)